MIHTYEGLEPISDEGLRQLKEKAWRRTGPPSLTYTLRVVTLRRLIARIEVAEATIKTDLGYTPAINSETP